MCRFGMCRLLHSQATTAVAHHRLLALTNLCRVPQQILVAANPLCPRPLRLKLQTLVDLTIQTVIQSASAADFQITPASVLLASCKALGCRAMVHTQQQRRLGLPRLLPTPCQTPFSMQTGLLQPLPLPPPHLQARQQPHPRLRRWSHHRPLLSHRHPQTRPPPRQEHCPSPAATWCPPLLRPLHKVSRGQSRCQLLALPSL